MHTGKQTYAQVYWVFTPNTGQIGCTIYIIAAKPGHKKLICMYTIPVVVGGMVKKRWLHIASVWVEQYPYYVIDRKKVEAKLGQARIHSSTPIPMCRRPVSGQIILTDQKTPDSTGVLLPRPKIDIVSWCHRAFVLYIYMDENEYLGEPTDHSRELWYASGTVS